MTPHLNGPVAGRWAAPAARQKHDHPANAATLPKEHTMQTLTFGLGDFYETVIEVESRTIDGAEFVVGILRFAEDDITANVEEYAAEQLEGFQPTRDAAYAKMCEHAQLYSPKFHVVTYASNDHAIEIREPKSPEAERNILDSAALSDLIADWYITGLLTWRPRA